MLAVATLVGAQTSDVTFDTLALTYPVGKEIKVPIIGTERFAKNIKGEAKVERRKSVTLVQIDIGRLPPPSQVGPAFTTYVIWAITPEGIADNLGEYRQRDSELADNLFGSEIRTSTPHQTFSLIITAEPYYLVSAPSRLVVVANQGGQGPGLTGMPNRISFSGDSDFERVLVSPEPAALRRDNKYPIELLQAQRALDVARYYESETLAPKMYERARMLLDNGENAYRENKLDAARALGQEGIRVADNARRLAASRKKAQQTRERISEKDELITQLEDEVRRKSETATEVRAELETEKRRRRGVEQDLEQLKRENELSRRERDLDRQDRDRARNDVARLEQENRQLKEQVQQAQQEATRIQQEAARREAERQQATKNAEKLKEIQDKGERALRQFETRREERGTVVVLADEEKLTLLTDFLQQVTNNVVIESYTDNRGTQDARFKFSQARAQALASYLQTRGINSGRIQIFANGGSNPRADNRTPQGRTANRRIELLIMDVNADNSTSKPGF
jgi:outer membrane protein OmpA-like peptidoglycan-associated protein